VVNLKHFLFTCFENKHVFALSVISFICVIVYFLLVILHRHIPLKLSLSNHIGYTAPKNIDFLGRVYVYYGYVLSDVDHQVCAASCLL